MRTFITLLAVSTAALAAAPAIAQSTDSADSSAVSRVDVTATAPRYHIRLDDVRAVRGTYAMSNGWTLNVTPHSRTILAQIDDGAPIELVALSPDRFETVDHATTMHFNEGLYREDMTMSYLLPDRTVMVIGTKPDTLAKR